MIFKVSFHEIESWEMVEAENKYQVETLVRKNRQDFPPGSYHVEVANSSDLLFHEAFERPILQCCPAPKRITNSPTGQ